MAGAAMTYLPKGLRDEANWARGGMHVAGAQNHQATVMRPVSAPPYVCGMIPPVSFYRHTIREHARHHTKDVVVEFHGIQPDVDLVPGLCGPGQTVEISVTYDANLVTAEGRAAGLLVFRFSDTRSAEHLMVKWGHTVRQTPGRAGLIFPARHVTTDMIQELEHTGMLIYLHHGNVAAGSNVMRPHQDNASIPNMRAAQAAQSPSSSGTSSSGPTGSSPTRTRDQTAAYQSHSYGNNGGRSLQLVRYPAVTGLSHTRGRRNDQDENLIITLQDVIDGLDARSTVMVRNLPNSLSFREFHDFLRRIMFGKFDFAYLRRDFRTGHNVGYAFINFVKFSYIIEFMRIVQGRPFPGWHNTNKRMYLSYATFQGRESLTDHFRNSAVMNCPDQDSRPKLFASEMSEDPSRVGEEEDFPPPNNMQRYERSIVRAHEEGLYDRRSMGRLIRQGYYDPGNPNACPSVTGTEAEMVAYVLRTPRLRRLIEEFPHE